MAVQLDPGVVAVALGGAVEAGRQGLADQVVADPGVLGRADGVGFDGEALDLGDGPLRVGARGGDVPQLFPALSGLLSYLIVSGQFAAAGELPPGPCLLVDDVRFSGWTLAMLAGQLRRRGAPAVYPLALTTAF